MKHNFVFSTVMLFHLVCPIQSASLLQNWFFELNLKRLWLDHTPLEGAEMCCLRSTTSFILALKIGKNVET